MKKDPLYVTSTEVVRRLRITRETLYAYVSRGLIRSEKIPGSHRKKWYYREDVENLLKKKEIRQNPGKAVRGALRWGEPILDSQITRIYDGSFYYRNISALELAEEAEFEDVFAFLVTGQHAPHELNFSLVKQIADGSTALNPLMLKVHPLDALLASIPIIAHEDSLRMDLRPESVMHKGYALAVTLTKRMLPSGLKEEGKTIARVLTESYSAVNRKKFERLLTQTLILGADHELSISAFAARVTASGQANPYEAIASGLYALRGRRHGGTTMALERFWNEIKKPPQVDRVIEDWLDQGKQIPGFAHPLYPEGDPRTKFLLEQMQAGFSKHPIMKKTTAILEKVETLLQLQPNYDFALIVLTRLLKWPEGSALSLFALARIAGLTAHVVEQYQDPALLRPRSRYKT